MGVTGKRIFVVLIGALGMTLAALGVAWACTSNAHFNVSQQTVSPGEVITLNGAQYQAGNEVQVRWGSKTGPIIATAITTDSRTFNASVTIPADAPAGEHLLFAVVPNLYPVDDEGVVKLRVLGDEPEPVVAPEPEPAPEPVAETEPVVEPEPVVAPVIEVAPEPVVAPAPAPVAEVAPEPVAPAPAPVPAPAPTVTVPEQVAATVATETVRVPAALTNGVVIATASQPQQVPGALTSGVAPETVQASSTDSSSALTNGWMSPERGASEWAGVSEASGSTSAVGAGLGLLAVGLMVLMVGFTFAALSRRKKAKVAGR